MKRNLNKTTVRLLSLLMVIILLFLGSCNVTDAPEESEPVDTAVYPPVRLTDKKGNKYYGESDFNKSYREADAVLLIRIKSWLFESADNSYFEAEVVETYKGKTSDKIIVRQFGSSNSTLENYPLYYPNNEFFIFLEEDYEYEHHRTVYQSINDGLTLSDYVKDSKGTEYIIPRSDNYVKGFPESLHMVDVSESMVEYLKKDPVWSEREGEWGQTAYVLEDLREYLKNKL